MSNPIDKFKKMNENVSKENKVKEKEYKIYGEYIKMIEDEIKKFDIEKEEKEEINNNLEKWNDSYIKESGIYEIFIKKIYIKECKIAIKMQSENNQIAIKSYDLTNDNSIYFLKKDIEYLLNVTGTQKENFASPKIATAFLMKYCRENILKFKIKITIKKDSDWLEIDFIK